MQRTRIKICGVTRPQDALAAADAGADAIGLVFHPAARRCVSPAAAREILNVLPPFVTPVGLFVDVDAATVLRTARDLGLRHVQLHGAESPDVVAQLTGLSVVKAVHVEAGRFKGVLDTWRAAVSSGRLPMLTGLVLETGGTGKAGGTGVPNDWPTVERHIAEGDFAGLPRVIAAGGLTPDSVGEVVRRIRPWAVDVSSGVEDEPGRKSAERIARFVRAVNDADQDMLQGNAVGR